MNISREPTGWEGLFWLVFERTTHPIVLLDDERRIVDANDAATTLWGGSRETLIGRSILDSIVPEERPQSAREWQAFMDSGEYAGDRELIRADGKQVHVSFAARHAVIGGRRLVGRP